MTLDIWLLISVFGLALVFLVLFGQWAVDQVRAPRRTERDGRLSSTIWKLGLAVLLGLAFIIVAIDPRELTGEHVTPPPDVYQRPMP